jgi:hypothetical protein
VLLQVYPTTSVSSLIPPLVLTLLGVLCYLHITLLHLVRLKVHPHRPFLTTITIVVTTFLFLHLHPGDAVLTAQLTRVATATGATRQQTVGRAGAPAAAMMRVLSRWTR